MGQSRHSLLIVKAGKEPHHHSADKTAAAIPNELDEPNESPSVIARTGRRDALMSSGSRPSMRESSGLVENTAAAIPNKLDGPNESASVFARVGRRSALESKRSILTSSGFLRKLSIAGKSQKEDAAKNHEYSECLRQTGVDHRACGLLRIQRERLVPLGHGNLSAGANFASKDLPSKGTLTQDADRVTILGIEETIRKAYVNTAVRVEIKRVCGTKNGRPRSKSAVKLANSDGGGSALEFAQQQANRDAIVVRRPTGNSLGQRGSSGSGGDGKNNSQVRGDASYDTGKQRISRKNQIRGTRNVLSGLQASNKPKDISLCGKQMRCEDVYELMSRLRGAVWETMEIHSLRLLNNQIAAEGLQTVLHWCSRVPALSSLKELHLGGNQLGLDGAIALHAAIVGEQAAEQETGAGSKEGEETEIKDWNPVTMSYSIRPKEVGASSGAGTEEVGETEEDTDTEEDIDAETGDRRMSGMSMLLAAGTSAIEAANKFAGGPMNSLLYLDVSRNALGPEGARVMAATLRETSTLKGLDMRHNNLDDASATTLIASSRQASQARGIVVRVWIEDKNLSAQVNRSRGDGAMRSAMSACGWLDDNQQAAAEGGGAAAE